VSARPEPIDLRPHFRVVAEALPEGAAIPVPKEFLLALLEQADHGAPTESPASVDRLLTAEVVAERLRLSVSQVYKQASRWPFTRKLSPRALRFSEAGLTRWLDRRGR
jgi:predicted DNA-binding transcriptional regulator AlpA